MTHNIMLLLLILLNASACTGLNTQQERPPMEAETQLVAIEAVKIKSQKDSNELLIEVMKQKSFEKALMMMNNEPKCKAPEKETLPEKEEEVDKIVKPKKMTCEEAMELARMTCRLPVGSKFVTYEEHSDPLWDLNPDGS